MQTPKTPSGINKVQHNLLTVVYVEVCQSCPGEERSAFYMHKTVFTCLLLNDLLHPRRPLIHQVPAPDAAIQSRVDLINRQCSCVGFRVLNSFSANQFEITQI